MNCSFDNWFKETTLHEKNILEEIKKNTKTISTKKITLFGLKQLSLTMIKIE